MVRRAVVVLAGASILVAGSAQAASNAGATIVAPPPIAVKVWNADTDNLVAVQGTVSLSGKPVAGVVVRVGTFRISAPTDAQGHFTYLVDGTLMARHVVTIADASQAKAAGVALTAAERSSLTASQGAISVVYTVKGLKVSRDSAGHPVVTGRVTNTAGTPPSTVGLYTYQLTGKVTDANGKPVANAQVSTRTQDRDYWTLSSVSDAQGNYTSLFTASSELSDDPVPFTVKVSKGDLVYQFLPLEFVYFKRLQSARLNVQLPPKGYPMALPQPKSYPGALYQGLVVGVAQGDTPVRPISTTWLDSTGAFTIVLPASLAGKTVSLWEGQLILFSKAAPQSGGPVDLQDYPTALPADAPRDVATVKLSG